MSRSTSQIEADIARTRAELQSTVDQLSERLDPRTQARRATAEAKAALAALRRRVTGDQGLPDDPKPTTTGWVLLGAGALAAAALVAAVIRRL